MLVPKDLFLSIILSTGIAWLTIFIIKESVGSFCGIFARRFVPQIRLRIAIVGLCLLGTLLMYFWMTDSDAFTVFFILFFFCCIPTFLFSAIILFGVKFVLKRIAPDSRAGWRIVFAMIGGGGVMWVTDSLRSGYMIPFYSFAFLLLLPFTAMCAIFFDIFGAICVKWFQARKAGQSDS
jgi:hypothetical protein